MFIPLALTWSPNLDPCCKSAILSAAIEIRIKSLMVFFTQQAFPIFIPLALTWSPDLDPCCKSATLTDAIKISIHVMCVFYQADISYFLFFGSYLRSQLGSSLQKCNLDKCDQNLHKRRLCFFTQQTFPIFIPLAVTWGPNFDFCCKNVIMACAIKIHINKVCVFLSNIHFPFSCLWLSLEVPTWLLAAKVLS